VGPFDYESQSSHSIRVRATDQGGLWYESSFSIAVTDGNDAPSQVTLSNVVPSLLGTGRVATAIPVADVAVVDDGRGSNSLTLSGPDAGVFELVAGQLRVKAGTILNASVKSQYQVTVQVDDVTIGGTSDASVNYILQLQRFLGITVQEGAAGRSYVRFVDLNFETPLGLDAIFSSLGSKSSRLQLQFAGLSGRLSSPRSLAGKVSVVGNRIRIDFGPNGVGGDRNSNQGNGLYRLRLDLDGDGKLEATASFHRVYGDADGNGGVDAGDQHVVSSQIGLSGINLSGDLDGNQTVNQTDLNRFKTRRGRRVRFS
jgi:hypothetical protein